MRNSNNEAFPLTLVDTGTGKSFVGALLAKVFHDFTSQTILVCCYTNHALDQFLEDLLDIGIPQSSIVRLGGKSTQRTEPLSLYNQRQMKKFGRSDWVLIDELKKNASDNLDRLRRNFDTFANSRVTLKQILAHLEFEDPLIHYALSVPHSVLMGDMKFVGRRGRAVDELYLINQWYSGWDAGILKGSHHVRETAEVWKMSPKERQARIAEWRDAIVKEKAEQLYDCGKVFNDYQDKLNRKFGENEEYTVLNKRIIGCTTTAAAKYSNYLRAALPQVVLVEEAGEILESHVLTALGEETRRLILIGDHKSVITFHYAIHLDSHAVIVGNFVPKSTTTPSLWKRVMDTTSTAHSSSVSSFAATHTKLSANSIACAPRFLRMFDGSLTQTWSTHRVHSTVRTSVASRTTSCSLLTPIPRRSTTS